MTPDDPLTGRAFRLLARYLRPDLPGSETEPKLAEALRAATDRLDREPVARLAEELERAREDSSISRAREALTAYVARTFLTRAVLQELTSSDVPERTTLWISRYVTAATRNAGRVAAIWRVTAGLATGDDEEIYDHALKSALAGETVEPVPGSAAAETPDPGTEDTMLDPTKLRDAILDEMAFDPTSLPKALKDEEKQKIYIDAVAQGVLRQMRFDDGDEEPARDWTAAAAALLLADGHTDPRDRKFYVHLQRVIVELAGSADETNQIEIDSHGVDMYAPDDETQRISIFRKTFQFVNRSQPGKKIFLQSLGRVARKMADRWTDHGGKPEVMAAMALTAYSNDVTGIGGSGGGGSGIANVDLPPLNDPQGHSDEIEPDNVRAVSTIYVTYQLEFALKAMSRILDLFVAGLLPISASDGSARELDDLYWDQDDLLDEASRRSVYARVLGAPGGEIAFDIQPNNEFNTLLMRVVSAVSEFEREQSALTHFDNASRGRRFQSTSGEFVRKAIRDFAANASLRGWAGTAFTAERMARHVKKAFRILGLPAVRNAFGVTTAWQVVERVSQREFGVTVNTVLHRTLASETQTIMRIIADNHGVWSLSDRPLFPEMGQRVPDLLDLMRRGMEAQARGMSAEEAMLSMTSTATSDLSVETTRELLVACQHFRAVTGVGDAMLEEYSAPVETAPVPSLPQMTGIGGGAMPGLDMGGMTELREMVASGQAPSLDQLRSMLPGF